MVDVVTDSGRVDPLRCARLVGVHPYEVEYLTLNELLHLHGRSRSVAVGGGIVGGSCALVELAVVTEEEIVIRVGGLPVTVNGLVVHVNVLGLDLTANEDVSGVTLAVAAVTTIGSVVLVRVGEDEFTVETVLVLHVLNHVVDASVVSSVRDNAATAEVVGLVTPETRVVVLLESLGYVVVSTGIGSATNGDVVAVGRLELEVRGIGALLLIEVERAFTLSHNISEVRDGYHLHSVTVINGFNRGSRGIVTHDFVLVLVGSYEYASNYTLYRNVSAVGGSSSRAERLRFSHTVDNRNLTVRAGHRDDVLLLGTRTVQASNVVSHSEGIGRSGSSSRSFRFGVLRGSGSTGSRLELEHVVVLRCEIVEVIERSEVSLGFSRGVHHNEYALVARIHLEALGRTDEGEVGLTGFGLFEREVRGTEGSLLLERELAGTGSGSVSLEDVNVYAFNKVITHPLTYVVVFGGVKILTVGGSTRSAIGKLKSELNRHGSRTIDVRLFDRGLDVFVRAGRECSHRGRSREEHCCEEKMFLHNE